MRWKRNKSVFTLVVAGLLGTLTSPSISAGAAPWVPSGKLDSRQQAQLSQLESRFAKALEEGAFPRVVETARTIALLRERWQGTRHWQSVDAREEVKRVEKLLGLSNSSQQDAGKSFRLEAEGAALQKQHKYQAAEALYRQALAVRRKALGEDHPMTANGYTSLATNLYAQGKYVEAQPLFAQALLIHRKVSGEKDASTAAGHSNVAAILNAMGKYLEAQPGYEKALAINLEVLGEKHPGTALAYDNVAFNLHLLGRHQKAHPLFKKALAIRIEVLGETHPDTASSYNNLAANLDAQGKHGEALPLHKKALAIRIKVLGEDDPSTANCYNNLAGNYYSQGKYDQAEPLLEKALAITRKLLGEEHPRTATSYNSAASNLGAQAKYAAAQALYEKALQIRRATLGEEHPHTALSYGNVAFNLHAQGLYAQAQPLFETALAIKRKVLGESHLDTANGYNNLAMNLDAGGKHVEAQRLYEKALTIRLAQLGEEHAATANSYNNLAVNLGSQGRHAQAQPLYQKALEIRLKVLPATHKDIGDSYSNVAFNLYSQGKYTEAQTVIEKVLARNRELLGEEHPGTAHAYSSVAAALAAQRRHDEAQPLLEKALAIRRKVLGEQHPETAITYNHLAVILWWRGQIAQAAHLLQSSLPAQEVARFHSAPSGFDRAIASAENVSPAILLALGLARLGQPAGAFRHAEASLARGLLDDLAGAAPEEARQIASLRAQLTRLDERLLPLFGRLTPSDDQKALREELVRQRSQVLSRLAQVTAEISARQLLPLADIKKQLAADTALVLWLSLDKVGEHQACIVRSRGVPVWVRLPGSGKDEAWTADDYNLPVHLYRLLQDPNPRERERQQLSAALTAQRLEPLRPYLAAGNGLPAVRRLLVVPTGWAGRVPLEVLGTGYRISYVPSGSVFARLKQQHRAVEGSSLLALGDPLFTMPTLRRPDPPAQGVLLTLVQPGGSASRAGLRAGDVLLQMGDKPLSSLDDLKKALSSGGGSLRYWREGDEKTVKLPAGPLGIAPDPRPAPRAVAAWRAAESSVVRRGPDPVALPGTRWEVQTLARLVPKSTALLGSDASEQRLDEMAKTKQLRSYRLIHLATHGLVDQETPGHSTLLLARDHLPDPLKLAVGQKNYTGELTVSAIRDHWHLDADLVVLSACKTALGKEGQGDGLLGFAQAFLQCGARSVVLSRWEADDTATALLMLRFYENLLGAPSRKDLKSPLPRAEALDEAKQWLRQLSKREAETLAVALRVGKLAGTARRGTVVEVDGKDRPKVKLPEGERPYAHPFYWAAFVLIGDPD